MKAVILAAGIGQRLTGGTGKPKCLISIDGKTLLARCLETLGQLNILEVVLVVGYEKDMIRDSAKSLDFPGTIVFVENPDFREGSILSAHAARAEFAGDVLLMDADVYFQDEILGRLVAADSGNLIAIDSTSGNSGEEVLAGVRGGRVLDMRRGLTGDYDMVGEVVGFYRLDETASETLRMILEYRVSAGERALGYEDVLPVLLRRTRFAPLVIDGLKWVEIDFDEDVRLAEKLARS